MTDRFQASRRAVLAGAAMSQLLLADAPAAAQSAAARGADRQGAVSPLAFGAAGDGVRDDTIAVQAAIDAAIARRVPLDLGGATYLVRKQGAATNAELFDIGGPELTVIGDGGANIRIAPDCGNYRAIFAPRTYQAVRNWRFIHVGFDKNSQNNVIPNDELRSNTPGRYSVVLRGHVAGQILFEGCVFHNSDAVVDIYLPEPFNDARGTRIMPPEARPTNNLVRILDCHWENARLGGTIERTGRGERGPDYDQSFINIAADQAIVSGCTLKGESWERAPTTFIEARCASLMVANNSARRLQVFANLTHNRHSRPHDRGLLCSGNLAEVCRRGIQVPWPVRQESVPAQGYVAGSGVHVVDNVIHHRWTEYRWDLPRLTGIAANMSGPAAAGPSVEFPGPRTYDLDDLTIARNRIVYDEPRGVDAMDRPGAVHRTPTGDAAIGWHAAAHPGWRVRRVDIADNEIVNCPGRAISCDEGAVQAFTVRGNKAVDCGRSVSARFGDPDSAVLFFSLAFEDPPVIENNKAWVGAALRPAEHPASFIHVRDRAGGTPASPVVLRGNDLFGATGCDYLADHPSLAGRVIIDGGIVPSTANSLGRFAGTVRAGSRVDLADARAGHRKVKRATAGREWTVES